jgi:hypothetical protein
MEPAELRLAVEHGEAVDRGDGCGGGLPHEECGRGVVDEVVDEKGSERGVRRE